MEEQSLSQHARHARYTRHHHLRDHRANYMLFFIESFGYPLAFSMISPATILPLLLINLGASNLVVGLLPALASLGAFLPCILAAVYLQRVPVKKYWLVTLGMLERLFILTMAAGLMIWSKSNPSLAILCILISWMMFNFMAGLVIPSYHSVLAKCLLPEERGGMIGWSGALAGIAGVFAAQAAGLVIARVTFPENYSILFVAAFLILSVSLLPFLLAREPADPVPEQVHSVRQYMREALGTLKTNSGYLWAVVAMSVISFSLMAASFYSTHAVRNLGASAEQIARLAAISVGTGVVSFPLLGKMADRRGHKRVLEITSASFAIAAALALASSSLAGVYCVIVLASIGTTGISVSQNVIWAEFAPCHSRVPMYASISLLLIMPFRVATPILAGWMADVWGFPAMFWTALVSGVAAWAILFIAVPEPRRMQSPQTQKCRPARARTDTPC